MAETQARKVQEPIAIIGIGCRLPGNVRSPSDMWALLSEERSGHGPVPDSRYNADAFYHSEQDHVGSINSKGGYFINEDTRKFENAFFGINNLEAKHMDPQQRKLLEVVYEASENAGIPLKDFSGSNTGVFVGNFTFDFAMMQYKDPDLFSRFTAVGSGPTILSNRISHCFDLKGPSVVLDTACSSSLYALHSACAALDARECDGCIVAAANLIHSPEMQIIAVKAGILSPDAKSHTFDASANGYGRAEGVGAIYIKRLEDAQRDGNPIRAIIRGTAVNGNGKTMGITLPSSSGQAAVIRGAYERGGLPLDETDYVEAHGTGTKVGDPIELESISTTLQHKTGRQIPVGGVKPSLGHSEGASGITSVIKMVLALENGLLPATIGVKKINPDLDCNGRNVRIVTRMEPWPETLTRRASINSFGFGGANGHAILEAAPMGCDTAQYCEHDDPEQLFMLPFSARSRNSLRTSIIQLKQHILKNRGQISLIRLQKTLLHHRSDFEKRGFLLARQGTQDHDITLDALQEVQDDMYSKRSITFNFTGQGAQWPMMGRTLLQHQPIFRNAIIEFDQVLKTLGGLAPTWSVQSILLSSELEYDRPDFAVQSQTVCAAVQVALVSLLESWNVSPSYVIGHSSGEIAAAYTAGYISFRQAALAAYLRGVSLDQCSNECAMLAVGLDESSVLGAIESCDTIDEVSVACHNSPVSVTLSGSRLGIGHVKEVLDRQGAFTKILSTGGRAYHSPYVALAGSEYDRLLTEHWGKPHRDQEHIRLKAVRMFSSVTGTEVLGREPNQPAYWRQNLESKVKFAAGFTCLLKTDDCHIIEVGPHPALEMPSRQIAASLSSQKGNLLYNATLIRGKDGQESFMTTMGTLFLNGHDLRRSAVSPRINHSKTGYDGLTNPRPLVDLPPYPWNYEKVNWEESRANAERRFRKYPRHELLGSNIPGIDPSVRMWRNVLSLDEVSFLKDHRLGPTIVFPAAGYLAMAIEAVLQTCDAHNTGVSIEMRDVEFLKALYLEEETSKLEMFTEVREHGLSNVSVSRVWWDFRIVTTINSETSLRVVGQIRLTRSFNSDRMWNLKKSEMREQAIRTWYGQFTRKGLSWGPRFAVLNRIFCDRLQSKHEAISGIRLLKTSKDVPGNSIYPVHPITIDGLLQTAFVATAAGKVRDLQAMVPIHLRGLQLAVPKTPEEGSGLSWYVDSSTKRVGFGTALISSELYNENDEALLRLDGVRCIAYQGNSQFRTDQDKSPIVRVIWKPDITHSQVDTSSCTASYLNRHNILGTTASDFTARSQRMAALLDLVLHKRPDLNITEVTCGPDDEQEVIQTVLLRGSGFRRFKDLTRHTLNSQLGLMGHSDVQEKVPSAVESREKQQSSADLLILTAALNRDLDSRKDVAIFLRQVPTTTTVILPHDIDIQVEGTLDRPLELSPIPGLIPGSALFKDLTDKPSEHPPILAIFQVLDASDVERFVEAFRVLAIFDIRPLAITDVVDASIPAGAIIISLLEINRPFLDSMSQRSLETIQLLTDKSSKLVWVTSGGLMDGLSPDFAVVLGLSRAIMLEQPSLQFAVYDIDGRSEIAVSARNISVILLQLFASRRADLEYIERLGVVHVSRMEPDERLSRVYLHRQSSVPEKKELGSVRRAALMIDDPGQLDTLHLVEDDFEDDIEAGFVEIDVKAIGLNAKDLYVLTARVDTKEASCSCECAGVVSRVGNGVLNMRPGDRVMAMAPGHFATSERFPEWACAKIEPQESYTVMSTVPVVFSTALYALKTCANLQRGESVLIHSAAGGVGIAAIQVAKSIGAEIFVTVSNDAKRSFVSEAFEIPSDHTFNSRNSSFLVELLQRTANRGVDVVLNSLTGELLHASVQACAPFGRFVEIGKRDILDGGRLNLNVFERNLSFTAFDLSGFYYSGLPAHQREWQGLLSECLRLIRDGVVKPVEPIKVFPASDITQAFRSFSQGNRIGKVAVSFEDQSSLVKLTPSQFDIKFDPKKAYVMIGCLGGLGRSLSQFMAARGAREFVFLGRSGDSKATAQQLVKDLRRVGCLVTVIRGDAGSIDDVNNAVNAAQSPIGGVVQAAMSLHESLWSTMPLEGWNTSLAAKQHGTWNLHNALKEHEASLDFFLMTSSIAGTIGTATESNYCAANAFLDAFARYRNRLGLPATSIGLGMISEVGYLHEHPDIEKLLTRKGISSINEDEMLQIFDLALTHQTRLPNSSSASAYDHLASSHLLTGIDFSGLRVQKEAGFEGDNHVLADPRAALFASVFTQATSGINDVSEQLNERLPREISSALTSGEAATLTEAVEMAVTRKIASLILLSFEELQLDQSLAGFGLDSMLAAEFRTYVFHSLGVDIPFMMMLGKAATVRSLASFITTAMNDRS